MTTPNNPPPTPTQFYIEYPLYETATFPPEKVEAGYRIKYSRDPIDAYCPGCSAHSIFLPTQRQSVPHDDDAWVHKHRFETTLVCSRNNQHNLYFVVQVIDSTMTKIGQLPSLADLNLHDVKKYAPVLEKSVFRELTKAIGLAAHGVGVGSFVYLRRVFEKLIEQAHQQAKAAANWDEKAYESSRMAEKIQLLAAFLPEFLVQNRQIYGILSLGVHELDESDCLNAFPAVKVGIEIILDAHIKAKEEQVKLATARQAIQKLANAAASKSSP